MSGAWIRTRPNKTGKSWQVLYRRGGRDYPIEAAGTFRTSREAKIRRDLVAGWLAGGLNPKAELARLLAAPEPTRTFIDSALRWQRSRIDVADATTRAQTAHIRKAADLTIANKPTRDLTVADFAETIAELSEDLAPSSVRRYIGTYRLVLDFDDIDPNPARDPRLKLPKVVTEEANPPTADQFLALLQAMPRRFWLFLIVLEQTAMRVTEASTITWGDVDEQGCRFRLRSASVKTSRARWVQVPGWLMAVVADTLPREDRATERRVFPGITAGAVRAAMDRACITAGLPHFHPHDLRHRRGSIWHADPSISIREQMERGGWSRSDIAIDTYSHLIAPDEVPADTLERLLVMPS